MEFFICCLFLGAALAAEPKTRLKYEDPMHGMKPGKFPKWFGGKEPSFNISYTPDPAMGPDSEDLGYDIFPPGPCAKKGPNQDGSVTGTPLPTKFPIIPEKCKPGDVMEGTSLEDITQGLKEVVKSGGILHDRSCAIGIANEGSSRSLRNPNWALNAGLIQASPAYSFDPGQTSLNYFTKNQGYLTGTSGILAYDIDGTDHRVVVMWSVPFDMNIYDIWLNMKVYKRHVAITESLWSHMYYDAGPWIARGYHSRTEYGIKLRATMTEDRHAHLILWLDADGYSSSGGFDLHTECNYHAWWFGYYCTQECYGHSWCWVNKRCSSDSNCNGRHQCYSSC